VRGRIEGKGGALGSWQNSKTMAKKRWKAAMRGWTEKPSGSVVVCGLLSRWLRRNRNF
jgi:hypothetical protein